MPLCLQHAAAVLPRMWLPVGVAAERAVSEENPGHHAFVYFAGILFAALMVGLFVDDGETFTEKVKHSLAAQFDCDGAPGRR